ncbi:ATP-binding protein [Georgenia ruanii]|uniref:biotin carboxylase n=1 Tax=Georgenia ruanii TaxID=348442 RepID=A0A7J9V038_9MICO|nr:biotin carboxylase N-terminal domain-containing protein [Georgenia ruanii]MPV90238.1 ATP-grasp domain-containing protein [Georgenia ruanii]
MFSTVLVANRGEIALRVVRAARAAGLRTVAVYSDADVEAPHVRAADAAVRLGPAPAAASYLHVPALLAAARATGADAVHPGYGFLAEDAGFARACLAAGLVWIGPPPDVVERMGRKDAARRAALAAGVPVLPAVAEDDDPPAHGGEAGDGARGAADPGARDHGAPDDAALAARALAEVGLPLLVKPAAGGGGKGMHLVTDPDALPVALAAARREAAAAFGDRALLVERYVPGGRHVEVQVLADTHGRVVHLGERDCSVQRRHQKVVEEAPAPTVSAALRARLTAAAVRLAAAIGYVGAGTVEFLVAGEQAYFLEMNTRLQVEHPVTEAVTGLDLVALQLAVAQGEPLPLRQEDVTVRGHAIEARVYAEGADFLPRAGRATTVRWPERARVDAALEPGQDVTTWYDPLLGKVISHGATREAARRRLVAALDDTAILGVATNTGVLRRLLGSEAFARAELDTTWLDTHPGAFPPGPPDLALCAGAWALTRPPDRGATDPFAVADGWRLGGPPAPVVVDLTHDGAQHRLLIEPGGQAAPAGARVTLVGDDGAVRRAATVHPETDPADTGPAGAGQLVRVEADGAWHRAVVERRSEAVAVVHEGEAYRFAVADRLVTILAAPADGLVSAPMPGLVRAVAVRAGEAVTVGQMLGVLEAMKMEVPLRAPCAGTVTQVAAAVGDQVELGQPLFTVTEEG